MLYSTVKLLKSPKIASMYQEEIDKMINNVFARIVKDKELLNQK